MRLILISLAVLVLAGCGNVRHVKSQWGEFESHKFFNADVQIEVVPAIGRIISYGPRDGQNLLWTDPAARQHPLYGWTNWGGDKIWLWPQDAWKDRGGKTWPPPMDRPGVKWTYKIDANTIQMTSDPLPGFDVRIVRHVRINRSGSKVLITNRLEPAGPNPAKDMVLWQITQVPVPDRLTAVAPADSLVQLDPKTKPLTVKKNAALLEFQREGDVGRKAWFDAHQVSALFDHTWFVLRHSREEGAYRPGERAQIYMAPDRDPGRPATVPPYVELEFTSPFVENGYATMTVLWELK